MSAEKKHVEAKAETVRTAETRKKAAPADEKRGEVVDFPQPEKPAPVEDSTGEVEAMVVDGAVDELADEGGVLSINRLTVNYDSITLAEHERGALVRIFREHWRHRINYHMSERGGNLSLEDACIMADAEYGKPPTPDERFQELMNYSTENVSFDQLMRMWCADSSLAEKYFSKVKQEAQREFTSGHMAAKVFEPVDWMSTVWARAQFLAVRDAYICDFRPEGGVEFQLIDTLVQCQFMQQYWMEQSVARTRTDPRRESYEYAKWQEYQRTHAKAVRHEWDNPTHWEIPYASELQCVENATQQLAIYTTLYQKTLRQLNQHRMLKLKLLKIKAETRRINALTRQTLRLTQSRD
jgi:hypothetical protein